MSTKRLGGWEPVRTTTFEYEDDDVHGKRLVRAVTVTEPEWDEDELGWQLAYTRYEEETCPGCGGQLSETTDSSTEGDWTVPAPHRCHRCTSLEVVREQYNEQARHPHALFFSAYRKR